MPALWRTTISCHYHKVSLTKGASYMPERETIERSQEDAREGKSPSTQAGEFVREEIHHVREGKHGARSPQQAIAIGLSKARRAGVKLGPPKGSASTRKKAQQDTRAAKAISPMLPMADPDASTLAAFRPRMVPFKPCCCFFSISCFSINVALAGKIAGKARNSPPTPGPHILATIAAATVIMPPAR